jgi:hypothetical protein
LREVLGHKKGEETGCRRKMYNKELRCLYSSPNTCIAMVQRRKIMWDGRVACMGEMRNSCKFSAENLKARECLKVIGILCG